MSSSHQFEIMSLQSFHENYHEVCHNYLLYSAILAIVSGLNVLTFVTINSTFFLSCDSLSIQKITLGA